MNYRFLFIFILSSIGYQSFSQEIAFTVKVNTHTLQVADPAVFKNFEKSVTEFLNNQRFTDIEVKDEERIKVSLNFNLVKEQSEKDFIFSIAILAVRPVYGTNYETVIFQVNLYKTSYFIIIINYKNTIFRNNYHLPDDIISYIFISLQALVFFQDCISYFQFRYKRFSSFL